MQTEVKKHVEADPALYTDALLSYAGLAGDCAHRVIDDAVQYVDGSGAHELLEKFWSLLKRGISATYVSHRASSPIFGSSISKRYHFKNRTLTDVERFSAALTGIVGEHLTFDHLTGIRKQPSRSLLSGRDAGSART